MPIADPSHERSMSQYTKGKATICIVNYKTFELTRLCLRSIRKFTEHPYEVIVVDNDSADESLDYLRGVPWITLLERRAKPGELGGGYAHAAALDLALERCRTEFFVSMHSDAFVHRQGWLDALLSHFGKNEHIACVGSGKLELIPQWRILLKKATDWRTFKRKLLCEGDPTGKYRYYNRTICSLYRTEILHREALTFVMGRDEGLTGGKKLYFELEDRGYETVALPPRTMGKHIIHLAHATQVINADEFPVKKRTIAKCRHFMQKAMESETVRGLLADTSLDR